MLLPHYHDIEEPLLNELQRRGGTAKPSDKDSLGRNVYDALAEHFALTEEDLNETIYENGKPRSKWENMVRWAKRKLVDKGKIARGQHGVWKIQ